MDESQRRAWRALGLGPEWAARGGVDSDAGAVAPADAGIGEPVARRVSDDAAVPQVADPHPPAVPAPMPVPAVTPAARPERDGQAGVGVAVGHDDSGIAADLTGELSTALTPARRRAIAIAALDWQPLREQVAGCTACGLCRTRSRTVFGVGATRARWMLVGEAPGAEEDARGEPFVGKAGQLLDAMLGAIGLDRRADVFIANVLKCRPPRNRDPQPDEVGACEPFLLRQIDLVAPEIIVVLGRFAAQSVLGSDGSIASLRGRLHRKQVGGRSIPLVVTYHPAYLLRTPADKGKVWADLLLARRSAGALDA